MTLFVHVTMMYFLYDFQSNATSLAIFFRMELDYIHMK